jgi:8-hydroxy-5-deazaflavin:NADPH oxidoreductase
VPSVIGQCGSLDGKVIIDATNPLTFGKDGLGLALGFSTSGGEEIASLASGAAVFKTMNQVGFEVMSDTSGFATRPVMFVAGDNEERKPLVLQLVNELGFEAVNAGPLCIARLLEPYAMLWIDQAVNRGAPRDNAFAFMRRQH